MFFLAELLRHYILAGSIKQKLNAGRGATLKRLFEQGETQIDDARNTANEI